MRQEDEPGAAKYSIVTQHFRREFQRGMRLSGNSLVNLGELSKPATVLIEKIADAVGGIFAPMQTVRMAKAEAKAELMKAESQIQISDIQRRALSRFLEEEARKQTNMEVITQGSLPLLAENASPEKIEDDWIANFFDRCRITSDAEMQSLWSGILAGEANSPGAFSKATVNLVSNLDKYDAQLFTTLCGYRWTIMSPTPLIFDVEHEIYTRLGLNFNTLSHLDYLGLIQFDNLAGFKRLRLPKVLQTFYFGRQAELMLPEDSENSLDLGYVLFTRAGHELSRVCGSQPIEGFHEHVYDKWAAAKYVSPRMMF